MQSKLISVEQAEAEASLAEALPVLEAARMALAELDKADITEIRSFATPPEPVQIICECVLILRGRYIITVKTQLINMHFKPIIFTGYREINWKAAKGMMAEGNFLRSLQEMNCDGITISQQRATKNHMAKSSKLTEMKSISKAGQYYYLYFLSMVTVLQLKNQFAQSVPALLISVF